MKYLLAILAFFACFTFSLPAQDSRRRMMQKLNADRSSGGGCSALTVINPGFEAYTGTPDDGTEDTLTGWSDGGSSPRREATTTAHGGSYALRITTATSFTTVSCWSSGITVLPSTGYTLKFWSRNLEAFGQFAYFGIYDGTHSAFITTATSDGNGTQSYQQVSYNFTTPAGCTAIYLFFQNDEAFIGSVLIDDVEVICQ